MIYQERGELVAVNITTSPSVILESLIPGIRRTAKASMEALIEEKVQEFRKELKQRLYSDLDYKLQTYFDNLMSEVNVKVTIDMRVDKNA